MGKNTQQKTASGVEREFSSGGVVYKPGGADKKEGDRILWLIARNNPSKLYPNEIWRLQKGWIDDQDGGNHPGPISAGERKATEKDLQEGAIREVREEGGVIARIIKKIGTSRYFMNSTRGRVMKFATFYLMEYVKDAPEGFCFETSEIAWLPYDEAYKRLTFSNEKEVLRKAKDILSK